MREILFRGKRIDNGEWVVGYYLKSASDFIAVDDGLVDGHWEVHKIDPDTLGQFTGLTDINYVKIFEGDRVKQLRRDDEYYICTVTYCFGSFIWKEITSSRNQLSTGCFLEVIGNTHDNKELLAEPNT